MSSLFEDDWSGVFPPLLPDLVVLFEGSVRDPYSPLSYLDAPQNWSSNEPEAPHPDIRGQDVWMGSPEHWPQPLEHSGSLSPLPVLRPPTPPSDCVSPQDIFSLITAFDDDADTNDAYPSPLPPSPETASSGSSPSSSSGESIYLPTPARATENLSSTTLSLATLSINTSPSPQQRKRPFEDDEQSSLLAPPRTRRRSMTPSFDDSEEDSEEEAMPRARPKSSAHRARKPESRVACRGCEQDFGRVAELTRHTKNSCPARSLAGDKPRSKTGTYQCAKCGRTVSRSDALVRHKRAGDGACRKYLASLQKSKA